MSVFKQKGVKIFYKSMVSDEAHFRHEYPLGASRAVRVELAHLAVGVCQSQERVAEWYRNAFEQFVFSGGLGISFET